MHASLLTDGEADSAVYTDVVVKMPRALRLAHSVVVV
jgi:hypothetical protein